MIEFDCQSDEIEKPILAEIISWGPSGMLDAMFSTKIVSYDRRLKSCTSISDENRRPGFQTMTVKV